MVFSLIAKTRLAPYLCKAQERTISADRIQKDTTMPLKHRSLTCSPGCAVEATLDLIDGKWKGLILYHLLQRTRRFNELRRLLPNVTQRMLTTQLREMEMNGIIVRTVYPQVPPRVDYSVSELGQSLSPVISALKAWADQHIDFTTGTPKILVGEKAA
jgi:DNA-binding HxlR family transcriptional regulator